MGRARAKNASSTHKPEFDLDPVVDTAHLAALSQKLLACIKGKDSVLKTLKAISFELEDAPQQVDALGAAQETLHCGLLAHIDSDDQEVRLYVAENAAKLLRVYAPDTPFTDDELVKVFELMIWALQRLANPSSPTFSLSLTVLHLMEQVKFYLLLLDMEGCKLVPKLIVTLLCSARDGNLEAMEQPVSEIVYNILAEAGDDAAAVLTADVVDSLLLAMVGRHSVDRASSKLARHIVHHAHDLLQPFLQARLTMLLNNQDDLQQQQAQHVATKESGSKHAPTKTEQEGAGTHLKGTDVLSAILQMYRCAPRVLLPVMPHVRGELEAESDARRCAAFDLMVELYCLPESDVAEQYASLKDSFFKRFVDHRQSVRLHAISQVTKLVAPASPVPFKSEVIEAATQRCLDHIEPVRAAACKAICSAACAHLSTVPLASIEAVAIRLRDSKRSVRATAATGLLQVFQAWAVRVGKSGLSDSLDPLAVWIPGRIACIAQVRPDLQPAVVASLSGMSLGLIPMSVGDNAAAMIWATVWEQTHPLERDALMASLVSRTRAQTLLAAYAQLQRAARSKAEAQNRDALMKRAARKLQELLSHVSWFSVMERSKAVEALTKLDEVKDVRVFDRLVTLSSPATCAVDSSNARKDLLERLGSKSALADAMSAVLGAALPLWLQPEHVRTLLDLALVMPSAPPAGMAGSVGLTGVAPGISTGLSGPALDMVAKLAKQTPALLAPHVPYIVELLAASNGGAVGRGRGGATGPGLVLPSGELQEVVLVKLLARVVGHATLTGSERDTLLEQSVPVLKRVCSHGPAQAARWAPRALWLLHADSTDAAAGELRQVGDVAMKLLRPFSVGDASTPAAIQAACGVAEMCPAAMEAHIRDLTTYVTDTYMTCSMDDLISRGGQKMRKGKRCQDDAGGDVTCAVELKARAMRALSRALCPIGQPTASAGALLSPPQQPAGDAGVASTREAGAFFIGVLGPMLDLDGDTSQFGVESDEHKGILRLAAAKALLRLGMQHDKAMPVPVWINLGLAMQDPLTHVRTCFGAAVNKHVAELQRASTADRTTSCSPAQGGSNNIPGMQRKLGTLASKYAAFLALAGMDPHKPNVEAAARALRVFVVARRAAAFAAARIHSRDDGNTVAQQPEHLLASLLYLLAHHPDMPAVGVEPDADGGQAALPDPDTLSAFCQMLQLALEALLVPPAWSGASLAAAAAAGSAAADIGASLPIVLKLLKTLKFMEDADTESPATSQLQALCDMASVLARAVVAHAHPRGENAASAARLEEYPCPIMLPQAFYVLPKDLKANRERLLDGRQLPPGFKPELSLDMWGAGTAKRLPPGLKDSPEGHVLSSPAGTKATAGKRKAARLAGRRAPKQASSDMSLPSESALVAPHANDSEPCVASGKPNSEAANSKHGRRGGAAVKRNRPPAANQCKAPKMQAEAPVRRQPGRAGKPAGTMQDPSSASDDE